MADINVLTQRRNSINQRIGAVNLELRKFLAQRAQGIDVDRAQAELDRLGQELGQLRLELADVEAQIAALQRIQAAPRESTGTTVVEAQTARDDSAGVQSPPISPLVNQQGRVVSAVTPSQTNAASAIASTQTDAGTNAPVRVAENLQSTPPITAAPGGLRPGVGSPNLAGPSGAGPGSDPVNATAGTVAPTIGTSPIPGQSRGAAAPNDDQSNATRSEITALFSSGEAQVVTQPNVLDRWVNYTYTVSIYIMGPQDYTSLITRKQKILNGFQLLLQSGGAPLTSNFVPQTNGVTDPGEVTGVTTQSLLTQGRNQYFPLDYYIDDLQVRSIINGKGTGGAHNVVSLKFKLIEPNGITFLDNLKRATAEYVANQAADVRSQNYASQHFLMVIRFMGYDAAGNPVPVTGGVYDRQGNLSGGEATIEKFIPFRFTDIRFRIADSLVEYQCEAVCPQIDINAGARGVIPYNMEITARTLQELFTGNRVTGGSAATNRTQTDPVEGQVNRDGTPPQNPFGTSGPLKADAAPSPTINLGLQQALNRFQEELVAKGTYEIPDEYEITIQSESLKNAYIVPPSTIVNQKQLSMGPARNAPAKQQKDPQTQSQDITTKTTSAFAGMSVVQFLDQYTRGSSYIYDQQTYVIDPKTGKPRPQGRPANVLAWYRIGFQAVPLFDKGIDTKRNDYAYKITYQLSPYKISTVKSDYFPTSLPQPPHKRYQYWFSGQNSQVLKFEQDFNYLYYLTINAPNVTEAIGATSNPDEYVKKIYSPTSAQPKTGQNQPVNEPGANAADYLYSPADQASAKMTIVGDPAWIQQGEVWSGVAGQNIIYGAFLNDGTINYEGQEIQFEIAFNKPTDYNLTTGLMDVGANNTNQDRNNNRPGLSTQRYTYKATEVISNFSRGSFTQDINGVLVLYPLTNQAGQPVSTGNQNAAETAGLQRQNDAAGISGAGALSLASRVPDQSPAETVRLQQQNAVALRTAIGRNPASYSPPSGSTLDLLGFGGESPSLGPAAPPVAPTTGGQPIGVPGSSLDLETGSVNSQPPQEIVREP